MQKVFSFSLTGGLDLVTPPLQLKPGWLIGCSNYEPSDEGGYRRVAGFERYSGLPSPSDADYFIVPFDAGDIEPTAGDILDGASSGASGEILYVVVETGDWATNDATGYFVVFNNNGTQYTDDELLQVSAVTQATCNGGSSRNSATTAALNETYLRAAREGRRADISALPGEGPIRGVWMYNGKVYAFRDNTGGGQCRMYEDTASGWSQIDLGEELAFTAGTSEFLEGETVTDGSASATIVAVGVTSGSWSGNDAAGVLYVKDRSGGNFSAGAITSASGAATGSGASNTVTLPGGGQYEFQNHNFGGQSSTRYMWGCNGVGRAFRFDGTDFAHIHITGLTDSTDKPRHLKAHKGHLFLTVESSLFNSATGQPMIYDAILGAAEIAVGDTILGLDTQAGGVLGIFTRNMTKILYGNDTLDFQLTEYSIERGAIEYTLQNVMQPLYLDDRGIMFLNPAQEFGDFKATSISEKIDPILQSNKDLVTTSCRIRRKNQYRLFFSNNVFIMARVTPNMQVQYTQGSYGMPVRCICSEEDANGDEQVFFGSDDGYVYQAEKGQSFDGELIDYYLRTPYMDAGHPRTRKRWHKVNALMEAVEAPDLHVLPDFSYGSAANAPPANTVTIDPDEINTGGANWGDANWGEFYWDGQLVGEIDAYLNGVGINMSLFIRGESNFQQQHTLQSMNIFYTQRGLRR